MNSSLLDNSDVDHSKISYWKNLQNRNRIKACLMWLFGCIFWVLSFIYPNSYNISPQITLIWRGAMSVTLGYIILKLRTNVNFQIIQNDQLWLCIIRAIIIAINYCIIAFSQFYLPLPYVHTLNSTLPIFTCIIDYLMNKNKLTLKQIIGMIGAFLGIFLIVFNASQPAPDKTGFKNYKQISKLSFILLQILLILNAAAVSFAFVITKRLTNVNPLLITFHQGVVFVIIGGLTQHINFFSLLGDTEISLEQPSVVPNIAISIYLAGFIFCGLIISVSNTVEIWAFKICPQTGKIVIIEYFTVVVAYMISVFSYSEPVNIICLLGALLITYGIYIMIK